MKQVLHNVMDGKIDLVEIPVPTVKAEHLLIATKKSLLSSGTERMLLSFGKAGWITKAQQQPEKVRQVIDKVRTDGLFATFSAVRSKLDEPMPLGYSNVGVVRAVGENVSGFQIGDRVVSNGPHAEIVLVPQHLCAKIPNGVDDLSATFVVTGAIGFQGIRLLQLDSSSTVAVIGLGLIGLQACQILRAFGARVIGFDPDSSRVALAKEFGAEAYILGESVDPVALAVTFSNGEGVDAVLITASTKSNEPIHYAAQMCRPRGKIVLVGMVGLHLNRDDFYKKEIAFQVSSSYGTDRYVTKGDETREVEGTVQKNFERVLQLMGEGKVHVAPLVSARFPIERTADAYERLFHDRNALGIVLEYEGNNDFSKTIVPLTPTVKTHDVNGVVVGCIGAGNFARQTLIPALERSGVRLKTIVSSGGVSGVAAGKKYAFEQAGSDARAIFEDKEINTVIISTPHNSHARFVIEALRAGKHVYVEKPLCITREELKNVQEAYTRAVTSKPLLLMIGFNRRFAPLTLCMKKELEQSMGPKSIIITVNAGAIPSDHWTQNPAVGGGRIIGEACHFIDLARFLAGSPIVHVETTLLKESDRTKLLSDTVTTTLQFQDSSIATIHYFANGSKRFPKERIEIFSNGRILQIDNFRTLRIYGKWGVKKARWWIQDKGHRDCVAAFARAVRERGKVPIPFDEIVEVTDATLKAAGV